VPAGDGWIHELKHDGFRILAFKAWPPQACLLQAALAVGIDDASMTPTTEIAKSFEGETSASDGLTRSPDPVRYADKFFIDAGKSGVSSSASRGSGHQSTNLRDPG
jgi:hypothetical protein